MIALRGLKCVCLFDVIIGAIKVVCMEMIVCVQNYTVWRLI
jgi:hypothetical protein